MADIVKLNTVEAANIVKVNDVARANFSKVLGQNLADASSGVTFTTDKLLVWYDAALESENSTTLSNRVDNTLTGAIVQHGHGAGAMGDASVVEVDNTQAMYLDGVNDGFLKRAYTTAADGSGEGGWGTSTFGVLSDDSNLTSDPSIQSLKNTGFTIEVWYRSNGAFNDQGQLWSFYSNNGIRARFNRTGGTTSGIRWFYTKGGQMHLTSGWGTYSQNVWYHDVTTVAVPGTEGSTSGRHTISLYVNGSLVKALTSRVLNTMTYYKDLIFFGGRDYSGTSISEAFKGYYGIIRVYHKALSSTEITANYNAEKSRYGY
jgi:hypothetical protein